MKEKKRGSKCNRIGVPRHSMKKVAFKSLLKKKKGPAETRKGLRRYQLSQSLPTKKK